MTITIVGRLCDTLGYAMIDDTWLDPDNPNRAYHERKIWKTPASEYRSVQPPRIGLDLDHDHDQAVGQVRYLERADAGLWCIATSDADDLADLEQPIYYSAEYRHRDHHDVELVGVALTFNPAAIGTRPVTILDGDLEMASCRWGGQQDLVKRAHNYDRKRRWGECHVIGEEPSFARRNTAALLDDVEMRRTSRPLELRSASADVVRHTARTIEIVAAPCETPALIVDHAGRYVEVFAHGAFAGEEKRADRIKVNRDHDLQRTVGRTLTLDPYDHRGLIATMHISKTPLGDETLELASDGALDASVAFGVPAGGDQWTDMRTRRRVNKAFLGHISLVPEPAYDTARPIAVRGYR